MKIKDYSKDIAEEIRLLLVARTLSSDNKSKIEVRNPKKSPNRISIYINGRHENKIQIIKKDKFVVNRPLPSWARGISVEVSRSHAGYELNSREELIDYIINLLL